MSFNDEYLKLRKKRLEEEEARRDNTNQNKVYLDTLFPDASSDIAPVRQTEQEQQMGTTDERKWFEKGAFEDGYQFGDLTKTIFGTSKDAETNFLSGIVGMGEKVVDALATIAPYVSQAQWNMNGGDFTAFTNPQIAKDFKDANEQSKTELQKFVEKDLYDEEAVARKIVTARSPLAWFDKSVMDESTSVLGEKSDALVQSGGQLVGTMALQAAGVPWFLTTGTTTFGSEAESAFQQGATYDEAALSATISAGAEILTEKLSGGISFGGKTLDAGLTNVLAANISNKTVRYLAKLGIDAVGEGGEEILSGVLSAVGQKLTYANEKEFNELFSTEEAFESFIGGLVLGGGANVIGGVKAKAEGTDAVTGLAKDEQAVVDKVFNDAIAEAEKDGKKLSAKQKTDLYNDVLNKLEKGYIDIDTIEEVLGEDVYKSYNDTIDYEDDILKQFEELGNKTNPTLAEQSLYAELKSQADGIKQNSQREAIKSRLSEEVFGKVKDTKLAESYNERARRGQVFEADLSQYDEKQQEVIKRAVESGILNNTNRTHEFVDLIAKISADKGVLFDFTNNAKLKESGFAVDGKEVNGFVTKDGISINIDSHKALQSTVGHEITHVLEGTELYAEMQRALFDYAKSKGDFDGRRQSLAELYKDIKDADVDAELTADLVGDYLFTDEDFVKHLSTQNRNVFQKIYDEIKYLWKLATAGGKEARELEKVKRAFDKAYKESGKADTTDDTKYKLTGKTADGIEVYETSQEIMDLTWDERKAKYLDVMKNEYRGRTAKFERNGHTYYAEFDQDSIRKPIYGDKRSSESGKKALIKAGADGDVFNLVENSKYRRSRPNTKDHTDADYFDYFVKTVQIDGKVFDLVADVEKKYGGDSGYVYTLALTENKKIKASPTHGLDPVKGVGNALSDDIISQKSEKSSGFGKFSLSDSDGKQLTKEQNDYFKDSKVRDENGNLKVMHHGSPETFTVFDRKKAKSSGTYGNGFYFTDSTSHAATYGDAYDVYLNITNPLKNGTNDITKDQIRRFVEAIAEDEDYGIDNYGYDATIDSVTDSVYGKSDFAMILDLNISCVGNMVEAIELFNKVNGTDYDGIIAPTETVAFYPNQIKIVDNLKPTGDPDIRYSLTEYTAEEKKAHNDAVLEHFGKTYKWAETGYLLLDGSKLDLSGKHDGAPGGYRTVDHRDITDALGYDYGGGDYSGSLVQFMSEGNIRIVPEIDGINLSVKPTKAQEQALSDFISRARGEVVLDIDDLNGNTVVSVEYPRGTYHAKVLNDIREWFDNGKQPETSGLSAFRSLTKKGEPQKRYGNYNIYGKDVRYEAPMQEQVAPVVDISKTETTTPTVSKMEQVADYAPITEEEANALQSENVDSLTDEDVPPEMEAPYYGETQDAAPIDPFEDRDMKEVSRDRKTPAYMYENPEVKPFFQAEANILLGELERVEKPETIYNGWAKYEMSYEFAQDIPEVYRTERIASDTIVYLRDTIGMSYADIEKGLKAIIEDHGAENIAAAKKLEFVINDRLLYGYNDDIGLEIPANQDYINLLTEKEIREYSEEARKQFFDVADDFAPITEDEIAPVAATTEETSEVPVKEQYEAIKPERKKSTEPRLKRVKDSETSADGKQRKWIGTSTESEAVDGKVTPDDIPDDMRYYQPIPNKVTLGNANTRLDSMGYDASLAYFNSQFANKRVSLDDIALGERLIQEAVKRGDTKTASELIQNVSILGTELGQKVQALSIIKRLSPEGQLRMLQKTVERGKTKGDKSFEGVEITQEMIDHILKTYGKDGTYDQTKLNEAVEDVKKQIADQMKVTKLEKVNAWRYLSMLGNPKTHIRNLVSNVAMQGTVAVKNAVARTIESVAPIENRTKTWKRASDAVKTFSQKTAMEMKDVLSDGGKYSEEASIKANRDTFKNKVLNKVYNFNSDMLSKEDWWFSKPAFTSALSEYLTANGIVTEQDIANNPKIVAKAKQYATEQSQIATFRQYSWLANKINEIEHRNVATNIAVGSILPFKKTPINIAKTGLNYSPLGFAKTLTYDAAQVKNGKMEASELVDHLSQNITGSALTLVGYLLASSGFLNGAGEDDKEGKYDYQLGEQAYSVTIGDATFSLSWLSPIAMPLFVGANAYEQLVEGKEWNGDVVVQTLAQTLDPLSEMSFLSSLDSVLSSYDSGIMKFAGIAQTAAQSYTSQFVPTLSSQVAAVMDDTKRTTKVAGDSTFKVFDEIINNLKYKIPGLRETLEPTTDIWGNEVKQTEDMLTRAFETFIAPYSKREDIATEIDSEIKSLYGMTGDDGLIPSIPYNYVNYNDEKYKMSAKEYTAYKEAYGQTAYNLLGELFDTETYRYASDEDKAEMVNKVYDYARDVAKQEFLAKKGVTYTNAKEDGEDIYREDNIKGAIEHDMTLDEYSFYREYPEKYAVAKSVGGYEKYKTYSNELYDIKADKDANGKSISGSRKEKVAEYINNLDAEYGEKIILFKSEYNADDTYNAEIVEYLNSRNDISYEEMVSILKELGFTVKGNTVTWD